MKPFNLEEAKAGKPVCTRGGKAARIICWDADNEKYPIIALIQSPMGESAASYTIDGTTFVGDYEDPLDLFMVSERAYRPFKSADEVMEAIKEHGDWVIDAHFADRYKITMFNDDFVQFGGVQTGETYDEALEGNTFADGTPFGVLEEEK